MPNHFAEPIKIDLKKDEILFLADEKEIDLYIVVKGKVMVFVQKGSEIIPVAYLGAGEYIGELSFFDRQIRSASVVCMEDSSFVRIPTKQMHEHCPKWMETLGRDLAKKIRKGDELIRSKGIRKKNVEGIKPLTISEQSHFFKLVDQKRHQKD